MAPAPPRRMLIVIACCFLAIWLTWPSQIDLFACPTSPTFEEHCKALSGDKCAGNLHNVEGPEHAGHDYGLLYTYFIQQLRCKRDLKFLEIGIGGGASIHMWRKFFTGGTLNFLDIQDKTKLQVRGTKVWVGDETDPMLADRILQSVGGRFDMVVDDGSHLPDNVKKNFMIYWPKLQPGGIYAIEDMNTGYHDMEIRRFRHQDMIKQFIDTLNREDFDSNFTAGVGRIDHDIHSVACSTELCLLRKKGGVHVVPGGLPAWIYISFTGTILIIYMKYGDALYQRFGGYKAVKQADGEVLGNPCEVEATS